MAELFCEERGAGSPLVLLHGFGASHAAWGEVVAALGGTRRTLAFDLPGHHRSLSCPHGSAAIAARAVLAAMEARGIRRAHWAGHSFGGAAAAVAALMQPEQFASLTLLAPGGFGREINQRLLRRFASAAETGEIALLLEQFFGWERGVPAGLAAQLAEERRAPGAVAALERIVDSFFDGDQQKLLGAADLARLSVPVKVVWGTQDRVLPTRQAHKLPGRIAVHIFEGTGHMLPQEIAAETTHLILENSR